MIINQGKRTVRLLAKRLVLSSRKEARDEQCSTTSCAPIQPWYLHDMSSLLSFPNPCPPKLAQKYKNFNFGSRVSLGSGTHPGGIRALVSDQKGTRIVPGRETCMPAAGTGRGPRVSSIASISACVAVDQIELRWLCWPVLKITAEGRKIRGW